MARGALDEGRFGEPGLTGFLLAAVLIFCIILIHELGHAAVAYRVGAEVRSIMVFPFQLDLRPLKFGMARAHKRGDVGGYVLFRLDSVDARREHILIATAGPVANLASAAIVVQLLSWLGRGGTAVGALATAFAILSGGIALANLIPFSGSDGMTILRLARRQKA